MLLRTKLNVCQGVDRTNVIHKLMICRRYFHETAKLFIARTVFFFRGVSLLHPDRSGFQFNALAWRNNVTSLEISWYPRVFDREAFGSLLLYRTLKSLKLLVRIALFEIHVNDMQWVSPLAHDLIARDVHCASLWYFAMLQLVGLVKKILQVKTAGITERCCSLTVAVRRSDSPSP